MTDNDNPRPVCLLRVDVAQQAVHLLWAQAQKFQEKR